MVFPMDEATRYTQDSHEQIRAQVDAGQAVLLDVREPEEWDATHLKQAKSVPLSALADLQTREAAMAIVPALSEPGLPVTTSGRWPTTTKRWLPASSTK